MQLLPDLLAAAPYVLLKLSPMADISLVCKELSNVKEVHVVATEGECKELLLLLEREYEGEYEIYICEDGHVLDVDLVRRQFGRGYILGGGLGPGGEIGPGPKSGWTWSKAVLFEPGKALLKAGAFELPCAYGLEKLGRHTHLYIGNVPEELKPFGKAYQILESEPLNNRSIKEIAKHYPQASVTARNIPLTSDQLRKKLGVKDGGSVHIFGAHSDLDDTNLLLVAVRCK